MKHHKRFFALMLAGVVLLGLAGCGGGPVGHDTSTRTTETKTSQLAPHIIFEPAEFGESDDPAMIALGKATENDLLVVQKSIDRWRLALPGGSICFDLMDMGDNWQLCVAMQMDSLWSAGLNRIWWNSGGVAFDQMSATASSFARPYDPDGLCLLFSGWWCKAEEKRSLPELLSSLTDQINPENRPFKEIEPGWYMIALDVFGNSRGGNPRLRFAKDGGAVEFVVDAGIYREGHLEPIKLEGWEYDAESDTLTKRIAALGQ